VSDPKKIALVLPYASPRTQSERKAFATQHLACQLYAGNHDMVIVGICDLFADEAEGAGRVVAPRGDSELAVVEPADVDLVLAVAPAEDDAAGTQFAAVIEQLRARQIDVVLLDRREV